MLKIKGITSGPPTLTVYPGYGHHANSNQNSDWKIRVSGIVYQVPDEYSVRKRMMIRMLRNVMQVSPDAFKTEVFRDRIAPFMADPVSGRHIIAKFGDEEYRLPKRTLRNGHFESWVRVPASVIDGIKQRSGALDRVEFSVALERQDADSVVGQAYLHQRQGVCVVSDIDDTIKETEVTDRRELLANTFLREFRGVPGMSEIYRHWSQQGVDFHYVSSSPWQLYDSLRSLESDLGFPTGTMHLRNFRLRDQLLRRVFIVRRRGKATAIHSLLKNLPHRKFVLIGDSGEKDPEIYAKVCRQYPGQVMGLFIRELAGRPLASERRQKFCNNLDVPFNVFRDSDELAKLIDPILEFAATVTE